MINSVIFGISGTGISDEEQKFFSAHKPLGFILFRRNIETPEQVTRLVKQLKELAGHEHVQILIDQEGGIVRRLKPPHFWDAKYNSVDFAKIAQVDLAAAKKAVEIYYSLIGTELYSLGINVDCAPVADLFFQGADAVIGVRSFGSDPQVVSELVSSAYQGLLSAGVQGIIKHIPGHGRAKVDSHKALPYVNTGLEDLVASDFIPFINNKQISWAMTAHIVYEAIDPSAPITLSKIGIDYIRNELGYHGLLLTDDLSMHALQGRFADRARQAYEAGCDVLLHCNGKMEEMLEIATELRTLTPQQKELVALSFEGVGSTCHSSIEEREGQLESIMAI